MKIQVLVDADSVAKAAAKFIAAEARAPVTFVAEDKVVQLASAPLKELQKKFGFEPDQVAAAAKELLGSAETS